MDKDVKRVEDMEKILDDYSKVLKDFNDAFEKLIDSQEDYEQLVDYYMNGQYMIDVEKSDRDEFPKDLKCGVLSEDSVFNLMTDNFHTAIKMLETATDMVKRN